MAVFRSNQHLYVQVIDDVAQHTLAAASTVTKEIREAMEETAGPTIVSFFLHRFK
jgi:large subunit ribosomal protein L18